MEPASGTRQAPRRCTPREALELFLARIDYGVGSETVRLLTSMLNAPLLAR